MRRTCLSVQASSRRRRGVTGVVDEDVTVPETGTRAVDGSGGVVTGRSFIVVLRGIHANNAAKSLAEMIRVLCGDREQAARPCRPSPDNRPCLLGTGPAESRRWDRASGERAVMSRYSLPAP